jgi:hypothetical protein
MKKLKNNSIARICLFFTNFTWYLFLALGTLAPILFLLAYLNRLPTQLDFNLTLPLAPEAVGIDSDIDHSAVSIDSAQAQMDLSYLSQHFPDIFLSWTIFTILLLAMTLLGLYQLKNLLQSTINDQVFTQHNIARIKIIALLVFSVDPLYWIYHNFFFDDLFADSSAHHISLTISSPTFNYWFIGLLIYVLAAVFEKGREMYQELKLTV